MEHQITIMEILRSIGIGLLTFYILPYLNVLFGLMLTSSICLFPVILQLISYEDQIKRRDMFYLKIGATIISVGSRLLWPVIIFFYQNTLNFGQLVSLSIILILISIGWTENYLPKIIIFGLVFSALGIYYLDIPTTWISTNFQHKPKCSTTRNQIKPLVMSIVNQIPNYLPFVIPKLRKK